MQKEEVEVEIDYDEGEEILRGSSKQEEAITTEKVLGKVKTKKQQKFRLKPFHIAKGKEKAFDNEGQSKESIEFQDRVMEEVVQGKQL